ncbi:MAG: STAS domain-containing protein [Planctomycetes bacterium]|nr:STAS domain-containing protein [Planctomycetota bacterium]
MSSLEWHFQSDGQREFLRVVGNVDVHTFQMFEAALQSLALNGVGTIELDLRKVESFNSPAVGVLVLLATHRRARGGNMQLLCREDGAVAPMLKRARLDGLLSLKYDPTA